MTIHGLLWNFSLRKLSRILYDCVECSHSDRSMLDWLTAEQFMKDNEAFFYKVRDAFLAQTRISSFDGNSLVSDLPPSIDVSYDGLDRSIGRSVWDNLYQPLRRALLIEFRMPRYTGIKFG